MHVLRGGERREEEDRKQVVATASGMEGRLQEGLPLVLGAVLGGTARRAGGLLRVWDPSPQVLLSGSICEARWAAPGLLSGLWAAPGRGGHGELCVLQHPSLPR